MKVYRPALDDNEINTIRAALDALAKAQGINSIIAIANVMLKFDAAIAAVNIPPAANEEESEDEDNS